MNRTSPHIQSAIKRHYGAIGDEFSLAPISKVDVDITNELVELLKKYEEFDAVRVMEKYKLNPDSEILENLMTLNVQVLQERGDPDFKGGDGEEKLPFWIHFNDIGRNRVLRPNVMNFCPLDGVGRDEGQYGILLNKTPENVKQVPFHANETLLYDEENEREKDMMLLESLSKY